MHLSKEQLGAEPAHQNSAKAVAGPLCLFLGCAFEGIVLAMKYCHTILSLAFAAVIAQGGCGGSGGAGARAHRGGGGGGGGSEGAENTPPLSRAYSWLMKKHQLKNVRQEQNNHDTQ